MNKKILKLYVVRDVLIGYGVVPGISAVINFENDEVALRALKESMFPGQKPNVFNVHPEDKELWCVGELDLDTGMITACQPVLIGKAIDYIVRGAEDEVN